MSAARTTRTPMPPSGVEWAAFPFFPCQRWVLAECKATRHSSSPDARRRLGIIRAAVGPAASLPGTQTSCGLPPNATRFIARASGIRPALAYLSEYFTKKNPRVDTRDSRVSLDHRDAEVQRHLPQRRLGGSGGAGGIAKPVTQVMRSVAVATELDHIR